MLLECMWRDPPVSSFYFAKETMAGAISIPRRAPPCRSGSTRTPAMDTGERDSKGCRAIHRIRIIKAGSEVSRHSLRAAT